MKTFKALLLMSILVLSSCGSANPQEVSSGTGGSEKKLTETDSAAQACEERSKLVEETLIASNTNTEVSLGFLGSTYSALGEDCYLAVMIDNDGEQTYNLLDVGTGRTYRSYDSLEKLEKEINFLGGTPDSSLPEFIGLSPEDALALAQENGIAFRVVMRDGEPLPATMDYRPGRINAAVEENIVISYKVEGE